LELLISGSETSDALSNSNIKSLKTISGAKLLKGVEKSYDKGVKLLDASEKESTNRYRLDDNKSDFNAEELVYKDKEITPEQQALLDGPNFRQYLATRELSEDKDTTNSTDTQANSKNNLEFRTAEEGVERENARLIQPWSEPIDALRAKRDVRREKLNTWEMERLMEEENMPFREVDAMGEAKDGEDMITPLKQMRERGVQVVHSTDELPEDSMARQAIEEKRNVTGWYDPRTGKYYIYMPNIKNVDELMRSFRHEGVAHMGVRELLGAEGFDSFCDNVWRDVMTDADREKYVAYVHKMSVKQFRELPKEERDRYYADVETQRAAADEYVAFTGEDGRYNNAGRWEKVLTWLREKLRKLGFNINFSDADIMRLLRRSDSAMEKRGDKPSEFGGEDSRYRFIGEKGAKRLDEREEATTRLDNLGVARDMETAGKDAKAIKMATGWERGADGKWRYETADFKRIDITGRIAFEKRNPDYARYVELQKKQVNHEILGEEGLTADEAKELADLGVVYNNIELNNAKSLKLYDVIDDDELFDSYPELKNVGFRFADLGDEGVRGCYNELDNEVVLNSNLKFRDEDVQRSVLIHEVQHAIQSQDGFALGGNHQTRIPRRLIETKEDLKHDIEKTKEAIANNEAILSKAEAEMDSKRNELNALNESVANGEISTDEYNKRAEALNADIKALKRSWLKKPAISMLKEHLARAEKALTEYDGDELRTAGFYGYHRLAGEVEARNAAKRMSMTDEERRASLASDTEDVAREDQIILNDMLNSNAEGRDKKRLPKEPYPLNANGADAPTKVDTKLVNNLLSIKQSYENRTTHKGKGLITDLTEKLSLEVKGSSRYRTFRTPNGDVFTLRVSNHRGKVSNFDKRGEPEAISIVIESLPKGDLINDGKAHVVEFKYKKKDLDNASGNPYVQIIESLSEALQTGVYKDKTGLTKPKEANAKKTEDSNDIRFRTAEEGVERENARLIQPWSEPLDAVMCAGRSSIRGRKSSSRTWSARRRNGRRSIRLSILTLPRSMEEQHCRSIMPTLMVKVVCRKRYAKRRRRWARYIMNVVSSYQCVL
jgi:hypothetical protein